MDASEIFHNPKDFRRFIFCWISFNVSKENVIDWLFYLHQMNERSVCGITYLVALLLDIYFWENSSWKSRKMTKHLQSNSQKVSGKLKKKTQKHLIKNRLWLLLHQVKRIIQKDRSKNSFKKGLNLNIVLTLSHWVWV